jgi:hypothetical protein
MAAIDWDALPPRWPPANCPAQPASGTSSESRPDRHRHPPGCRAATVTVSLDTADAIELAETLQLIARWLAADPGPSHRHSWLIGHPAYGLDALRADLDRFTFLLGGSDGEDLFGQHLRPAASATWPRH